VFLSTCVPLAILINFTVLIDDVLDQGIQKIELKSLCTQSWISAVHHMSQCVKQTRSGKFTRKKDKKPNSRTKEASSNRPKRS